MALGDTYFVTVTCVNKAGVPSSATHASGNVMQVGSVRSLQIARLTCDTATCDGDCTCGYQHRCDLTLGSCTTTTALAGLSLSIEASSAAFDMVRMTPSNTATRRAQYSLGLAGQAPGSGVFQAGEDVWYDYGAVSPVMFGVPRPLISGSSYTAYMRVWRTPTQYQIVKSTNNIVMTDAEPTLPVVTLTPRSGVRQFRVTWSAGGVDRSVAQLHVALGSHPGAVDLIDYTAVAAGSSSQLLTVPASGSDQVVVYATLRGTTASGVEAFKSSNAITMDLTPPTAGVVRAVFNNVSWRHHGYTSATDGLDLAWSGFADPASGIDTYHVCIGRPVANDCSVASWTSVGRRARAFVAATLAAGTTYRASVRAVNEAGLISSISTADVQCDTTPPVLSQALRVQPSFVASRVDGRAGGVLSLSVTWAATDPESVVESSYLMLGSTSLGQQLLAPTAVVDSPVVHLVTVSACPSQVFATLVVKNAAGLVAELQTRAAVTCPEL